AGDLYPEYFLLRVDDFNSAAQSSLDEWISFLKTGDIPEEFTAPGLPEARECLKEDSMSAEERRRYRSLVESQVYQRSVISTGYKDGYTDGQKDGRKAGMAEGRKEERRKIVLSMKSKGMSIGEIASVLGLPEQEIEDLS
ncbi:MAG: hypothetical protein LBH25_03845, partial [Fibromonadaceae bacterium]|nr:hypothetical protein [Fibromonadaceae bacterium]